MSTIGNGQFICCDGAGCRARALAPVGFRKLLSKEDDARGWLFISRGGTWAHYCPECAVKSAGADHFARLERERAET